MAEKKKKYKFTVMDYVTIGFTAVIVIVMVVFLIKTLKPELFERKNNNNTPAVTQQNEVPATGAPTAEQPTEAPYYSGIGNVYGNMSNDAAAAEADGRTYFVDSEESGSKALKVSNGESERVLVSGEKRISSVCAIKDPFTYADVAGSKAYLVTFIDGEGRICAVTDGPLPSGDDSSVSEDDATVTAKKVIAEGTYRSALSVGGQLYCIDGDGYIVKISLEDAAKTVLSKGRYSALCVYFGSIYAVSQSGDLYLLSTTARPADEADGTDNGSDNSDADGDKYEQLIAHGRYTCIAVFDDWVYAGGPDGFDRYDADKYGRDSLTAAFAPVAVNVDRRGIFFLIAEGTGNGGGTELSLYKATAKNLLSGRAELIGKYAPGISENAPSATSYRITLCSSYAIVSSAEGGEIFKAELGDQNG